VLTTNPYAKGNGGALAPLEYGAMRKFAKIALDEKGATAIEYALIVSLIVIAMIVGLGRFATTTTNMWNYVENEVGSV
jgi:pilus assembly protein Flp/PilA